MEPDSLGISGQQGTSAVSDEKPTTSTLTVAKVREIVRKLAAEDALRSGSGWLRLHPDGTIEHVPIEEVMAWEKLPPDA